MIAVVTGATSGIGRAIAEALLARGDTVVGVGRSRAALAELSPSPRFVAVEHDLHDIDGFTTKLSTTVGELGGVDLLVNNAGVAESRSIPESTPSFVQETLDVNLAAPAAAIHALWPHLATSCGRIINVSSLAQLDPFPGFFAYAASKAGLHLLTVVAAAEGAPSGIRAVTIAPGVVDTPLHRSMMPDSIPPTDGKLAVFQPIDVARVVCEVIDGAHDTHNGWVLAMPAPAAVDAIEEWVSSHPGGGVKIVQ
ncbi:MAG: hypothetical protein RJB08_475 [Actinomycetota bacterium]|jgi:NAD(P)-dependent dehydrogenase (short-subunit alcohol dehydrogenase family)